MTLFAAALINELKIIKGKIILVIALVLILVLSVFTAYTVANKSLGENSLRLDVIVVNHDNTPQTQMVLNLLLENEYIKNSFNVEYNESEENAKESIMNSNSSALVVFPEGFLSGVLSGQNPSPTIYVSNSTSIEDFLITSFSDNLSNVMLNLQSGVYAVLERARELGYFDENSVLEINLEYVNAYLTRAQSFDIQNLDYTDSLSLEGFYTISISLFLLFLSASLFFKELNIDKSLALYKYLNRSGRSPLVLYFSKVVIIFVLYSTVFTILFSLSGFKFSLFSTAYLLNACIFFVLLECLIFNFSKNQIATIEINLFLHSIFFIISGGLIPIDFMPKFIGDISIISPHLHLRNAMAYGFSSSLIGSLVLLISNAVMLILIIILMKKKMEVDYTNDYI